VKTKAYHYLRNSFFVMAFLLFSSIAAYAQVADTASTAMGPQSIFNTHGSIAEVQLDVFWYTVYVSGFLLITVGGVFLYAIFKYKAKPGENFKVPESSHGSSAVEVGLIIASCILLLVIAIPNAKALFMMDGPPEAKKENVLKVVAIGHQWWWEFQYPELGITTANELHIPTKRSISVEIRSVDVIHSFWIPQLAGKMDATPGQVNRMWLDAKDPGKYYGQCTEFCGDSHANMRFLTFAHPESEFDAWAKAEKKNAAKAETPSEVNGEAIFMSGCNSCHAIRGTNAVGSKGPDLTHFGSRETFGAVMFDNKSEHLFDWIKDPKKMKPGSLMDLNSVNLNLTDKNIHNLVAYLNKLK